ncbi:MAG TPA: hypothetical protein VFP55_05105 [Solirubrobacteraceae bacterium]|nr:hypothetical protein [Solirubrobacteraceae bacterium]
MKEVHLVVGVASLVVTGAAALWGGWCWWRWKPGGWFWRLLRAAQATVVLEAAFGGVLVLMHHKAVSLHYIYGVLPILVSFIGEQLRIASAQMIMDSRGFGSTAEVAQLPAAEQQQLVRSIVRREVGVMTLAALVMFVLLGRAAMVVH